MRDEILIHLFSRINFHLSRRRYSKQLLDSEINRTINTSNNSSLLCSNQPNQNHMPLVVMYHPTLPMLKRTIRRYHHILQDSERLREAIPSLPTIAFHHPKNVHNLLVCAIISSDMNNVSGNFCCDAERCKTCPILVTTDTFISKVTGECFKLKLCTACKTSNIIYLIQCRRCGLQYEGDPLHYRMNGHRFDIVHCQTDVSSVVAHFTSEGHPETDLLVIIIDICWKEDTILRKFKESRWIKMLVTLGLQD